MLSNSWLETVFTTQLNHLANLAKWLSVRLQTKWLWIRIPLLSLKPPMNYKHFQKLLPYIHYEKILRANAAILLA